MASPRLVALLIILLSLISPLLYITTSISDTIIYGGCSKLKYNPSSPYDSNLNSLLTSLINSASTSSYNKNTVTGSNPQDIIYGHYQCRGDLAMHDCATCVTHSVSQLGTLCHQTSGGVAQLEGCYVKYDNISFIGVEDKSVVMKKCDPLINNNNNNNNGGNSMDGRDEVLGSLGGAGGAYRVGGSGDTQGMAQCVEDLSGGECEDCLMEAIGRLKSECDGAVSGEMFLGKCYVKYSTTTTSRDHVDESDHGNSNNEDGGEKTFALIIGILAGIALLVIFITFLGRVFGGNDEEFRGRRLEKCPHEDKV